MDDDSAASALLLRGHVDALTPVVEDAPQNGCTEVTERGTLPTGEHRSGEASVTRKREMANGIHALVHAMEPFLPHPHLDLPPTELETHELIPRHHAVLPPRKLRNTRVAGVLLVSCTHTVHKSRSTPDSPPQCPPFVHSQPGGGADRRA